LAGLETAACFGLTGTGGVGFVAGLLIIGGLATWACFGTALLKAGGLATSLTGAALTSFLYSTFVSCVFLVSITTAAFVFSALVSAGVVVFYTTIAFVSALLSAARGVLTSSTFSLTTFLFP